MMMAAVTIRQIKPGTYEQFREAWQPDPWYPQLRNALILRHQDDPEQVLTVGFLDLDADAADALRDDPEILRAEEARLRRIAPFEERVLLNGVYEVSEEVTAPW